MPKRRIDELAPHPLNAQIYGDDPVDDLVANIRERLANGQPPLTNPITITSDGIIVAGRRRHRAAKEVGLPEVEVRIVEFKNDLEMEEHLIHDNKKRHRTKYMRCNEAMNLLEFEQKRAKLRQQEAASRAGKASGRSRRGESNLRDSVPGRSDQEVRARDKVGEFLELSGKTAEKAAKIGREIKRAMEEDQKWAEYLIEVVNTRGIDPAYQEIKTAAEQLAADPVPAVVVSHLGKGHGEITASRVLIVAHAEKEAIAQGNVELAERLTRVTNEHGFHAAYDEMMKARREAEPPKVMRAKPQQRKDRAKASPSGLRPAGEDHPTPDESISIATADELGPSLELFTKIREQLLQVRASIEQLQQLPGGELVKHYGVVVNLDDVALEIGNCQPAAHPIDHCFQCGGVRGSERCPVCNDNGWISSAVWNDEITNEEKKLYTVLSEPADSKPA